MSLLKRRTITAKLIYNNHNENVESLELAGQKI